MELPITTIDTAPADSQKLLQGIADDLGFVPNMAATVANSPTLLAAFDGLRRAVGAADFDPVLREVAGLAVGVAVDNRYGVAFHSTMLDRLGVEGSDVDAMRAGQLPSAPAQAAAYALARDLVCTRGKVDAAAMERALTHLTVATVLEIVAEATFAGLVGMIDNLAGRVPLDAIIAPRAWE